MVFNTFEFEVVGDLPGFRELWGSWEGVQAEIGEDGFLEISFVSNQEGFGCFFLIPELVDKELGVIPLDLDLRSRGFFLDTQSSNINIIQVILIVLSVVRQLKQRVSKVKIKRFKPWNWLC